MNKETIQYEFIGDPINYPTYLRVLFECSLWCLIDEIKPNSYQRTRANDLFEDLIKHAHKADTFGIKICRDEKLYCPHSDEVMFKDGFIESLCVIPNVNGADKFIWLYFKLDQANFIFETFKHDLCQL